MEKQIVTRYAPSPTGKFHIGGARTALFNYLFAKANNGLFILRIEDTDTKRNQEGKDNEQIDNLMWLGIIPDLLPGSKDRREPFKQSERKQIYQRHIDYLLEKRLAYKCYCTDKELEDSRKEQLARGVISPQYNQKCYKNPPKDTSGKAYSIRLHVPDDLTFSWYDKVREKVIIPSNSIGDWIIQKSNGQPTYNFANVIDDHYMEVTHVLRGEEHLTNTARQIHLYQIFNWNIPKFAHLTIITNSEGKKLSKRDETVMQFISNYKERGYLPEAIINYLAFLGWSSKNEREIYSKDELIKIFSLKGFSKSPSQFNLDKLKWMNNIYIQKLKKDELFNFLNSFIKDSKTTKETKEKIFELFKPQLNEGIEISNLYPLFTKKIIVNSPVKNVYNQNKILFEMFNNNIKKLKVWNEFNIKSIINEIGVKLNLRGRNLMYPLRYIFTNEDSGPSIVKILEIYGKEKTLDILSKLIK